MQSACRTAEILKSSMEAGDAAARLRLPIFTQSSITLRIAEPAPAFWSTVAARGCRRIGRTRAALGIGRASVYRVL